MTYRPPPPDCFDDLALQIATLSTQIEAIRIRLDAPRFDGTDTHRWIYKISEYFTHHPTPEEDRVTVASFNFDGVALAWYRWMHMNNQIASWAQFLCALEIRFPYVHKAAYSTPTAPILASDLEFFTISDSDSDDCVSSQSSDLTSDSTSDSITELLAASDSADHESSDSRDDIVSTSTEIVTAHMKQKLLFGEVNFSVEAVQLISDINDEVNFENHINHLTSLVPHNILNSRSELEYFNKSVAIASEMTLGDLKPSHGQLLDDKLVYFLVALNPPPPQPPDLTGFPQPLKPPDWTHAAVARPPPLSAQTELQCCVISTMRFTLTPLCRFSHINCCYGFVLHMFDEMPYWIVLLLFDELSDWIVLHSNYQFSLMCCFAIPSYNQHNVGFLIALLCVCTIILHHILDWNLHVYKPLLSCCMFKFVKMIGPWMFWGVLLLCLTCLKVLIPDRGYFQYLTIQMVSTTMVYHALVLAYMDQTAYRSRYSNYVIAKELFRMGFEREWGDYQSCTVTRELEMLHLPWDILQARSLFTLETFLQNVHLVLIFVISLTPSHLWQVQLLGSMIISFECTLTVKEYLIAFSLLQITKLNEAIGVNIQHNLVDDDVVSHAHLTTLLKVVDSAKATSVIKILFYLLSVYSNSLLQSQDAYILLNKASIHEQYYAYLVNVFSSLVKGFDSFRASQVEVTAFSPLGCLHFHDAGFGFLLSDGIILKGQVAMLVLLVRGANICTMDQLFDQPTVMGKVTITTMHLIQECGKDRIFKTSLSGPGWKGGSSIEMMISCERKGMLFIIATYCKSQADEYKHPWLYQNLEFYNVNHGMLPSWVNSRMTCINSQWRVSATSNTLEMVWRIFPDFHGTLMQKRHIWDPGEHFQMSKVLWSLQSKEWDPGKVFHG